MSSLVSLEGEYLAGRCPLASIARMSRVGIFGPARRREGNVGRHSGADTAESITTFVVRKEGV